MANRSPFPGMNPFLEEPHGWRGVHTVLLGSLWSQVARSVGPNYLTRIEERVYVTDWAEIRSQMFVPDVTVIAGNRRRQSLSRAGATITEPVRMSLEGEEVRERFLVVLDRARRQVVTAIELLSPTNKTPGSHGFDSLVSKRDEIVGAGSSWLEIDLLRHGERHPLLEGRSDYCAALWRAGAYRQEVWFFNVSDPLPTIAVPLLAPDHDAPLDLQAVLDDAYLRAPIDQDIDYDAAVPDPPLLEAEESWLRDRVAAWRTEQQAG